MAAKRKQKKQATTPKPKARRRGKPSLTGEIGRTPARMLGRVPSPQWVAWHKVCSAKGLTFAAWARKTLDKAAGFSA